MAQNQSDRTGQSREQGREMTQGGQRGDNQTMTRRGGDFPSMFTLNPIEFLTMSPFALMRRFSDEFDRLSGSEAGSAGRSAAIWSPTIEVRQQGNELQICADLPGIKPDDVQVEMTDEGLVIQGERRREQEESGQGFRRSERSYGRFYRLIPLPETINAEQVRADFHDGVLEVHVQIPEQRESRRRIPIQGAGQQRQRGTGATSGRGTEAETTQSGSGKSSGSK